MAQATIKPLNITKPEAVSLFEALGIASAGKWGPKRLATKLASVDKIVDDTTVIEDVNVDKVLTLVLEAIEEGNAITVGTTAPEEPKAKPGKVAKKKTAAAKPATPAEPASDEPKLVGVRATVTRPYLAGKIIQSVGMEVGITEEMVQQLDEEYGKANPSESWFALRNAWHAIRGFNG